MKRDRTGVVYYRKPGLMRWEFGGQDQEIIVSDGKQLYSYDPGLNQVIVTPLEQAFQVPKRRVVSARPRKCSARFRCDVPADAPNDDLKHVALTPKNGGDTLEMGLDPATLDLRSLRITDQLGDVTDLTFSEIKNGATLGDKLFAFSPPHGADIVEAPQPPQPSHP